MNDGAPQKNNTGFPSGTGSPCYMKIETFRVLIKHIEEEIESERLHLSKTSSLHNWKPLGVIKDLQLVNPQAISLCIWTPLPKAK